MTFDAYQRERVGTLRPIMQWIATQPRRGPAMKTAAARVGFSDRTLEALFSRWNVDGDMALIEKRRLPKAKKAASESLNISGEERNKLRQLVLKCDSIPFALEAFADLPDTREELRELINRHRSRRNYPRILRRAAMTTPEERDLARGPKCFHLHMSTQLRTNTWVDSAGVEHELRGGDIFECDDMSLNQPFWYEWPYGGDRLSDMFGVRLGRQMLASIDTATGKWLGFDLIGRVRDAYRAEDVVRFLGRICDTAGVPRLGFRLERGVWASRSVRGVKGVRDDGEREVFASIRDAVAIHYVYRPKAKGIIEGSFDMLQTILSLSGIQIGRERGEYEKATAAMLKCADGRMHPQKAGFPHINEIAQRVADAMQTADDRPKMGRLLKGIPQERFDTDVTSAPLLAVPEEQRHLFLPVKKLARIDGTFARVKAPHYAHTFSFAVPDRLALLGRGYRLLVCFDPADPHAGARVFDAESADGLHFDSVAGQSYGIFAFAPDAPQMNFSNAEKSGQGKSYSAAARTHFRATGMRQGTGASIDQVADGHGSSTRIARGLNIAAPENLPPTNPRAAEALHARCNHVAGGQRAAHDRALAAELLEAFA